jgi:hypothetical protein
MPAPAGTYVTPEGFWNPIIWLTAFLISLLIAYIIWSRGEKSYKRESEQVKPFYAGNIIESREKAHIRAHNIYWGFIDALKPYDEAMKKIHTGDVNDYIAWFMGVLSLMLVIYFLWGVKP